jgi:hypothetical protein
MHLYHKAESAPQHCTIQTKQPREEAVGLVLQSLRRYDPDQVLRVEGCDPPLSLGDRLPVMLA